MLHLLCCGALGGFRRAVTSPMHYIGLFLSLETVLFHSGVYLLIALWLVVAQCQLFAEGLQALSRGGWRSQQFCPLLLQESCSVLVLCVSGSLLSACSLVLVSGFYPCSNTDHLSLSTSRGWWQPYSFPSLHLPRSLRL